MAVHSSGKARLLQTAVAQSNWSSTNNFVVDL